MAEKSVLHRSRTGFDKNLKRQTAAKSEACRPALGGSATHQLKPWCPRGLGIDAPAASEDCGVTCKGPSATLRWETSCTCPPGPYPTPEWRSHQTCPHHHCRAPSSSAYPMPGAPPRHISPGKRANQSRFPPTFLFSCFSKIKTLFQHQGRIFFPVSEVPQGISRKMETFATHPRTENWVASSFHLVQRLLPALWDKSPSRSDKAS